MENDDPWEDIKVHQPQRRSGPGGGFGAPILARVAGTRSSQLGMARMATAERRISIPDESSNPQEADGVVRVRLL